jgi:hypothetical protein
MKFQDLENKVHKYLWLIPKKQISIYYALIMTELDALEPFVNSEKVKCEECEIIPEIIYHLKKYGYEMSVCGLCIDKGRKIIDGIFEKSSK